MRRFFLCYNKSKGGSILKKIVHFLFFIVFVYIFGTVLAMVVPTHIDMPLLLQKPEFTNGCEAASVAMVAQSKGMNSVYINEVVDTYLPKGPIGTTDPHEAYIGDPRGEGNGYYAYPEVVAQTANALFQARGLQTHAKAYEHLDPLRLFLTIQRGKPVIVWITSDDKLPRKQEGVTWSLASGSYTPYENLHVAVLNGIDMGKVKVQDPLYGTRKINAVTFLKMYLSLQAKAVTIN